MVLNIKDAETDRLARALAVATGGSLTEAVREALAHRLAQLSGGVRREEMLAGMRRIGRDCAARMTPPCASEDHGDLLHDADGSPR